MVPQSGYMIMDRYFRNTGNQGGVMLRATASTRVTIRYTSEADFVRKFRVACLITPLLALLTDNVHCTRGNSTITTAFIPTSGTMWTPTAAAFTPT